jgi:hypothetical protein
MADAPLKEGRLRRWSRLKRSGEDAEATAPAPETAVETAYAVPDPNALPGGAAARRRSHVPAMPALAGEEDDDTGETGAVAAQPETDAEAPADEEIPELTEEEAAIVAELPPIESLSKDSDFTPFLADKVPEFIRRRALSVLWRSDPVLANLDGLNDYDENFRIIDTLIDAAQDTIYRVGKGHKTEDEEEDAVAADDADADADADAAGTSGDTPGEAGTADADTQADADAGEAEAAEAEPERLSGSSVRKPEERG